MNYYVFNKPYGVLSQFTSDNEKLNLSDYLKIEKDCYPIGRLDYDSEGLIIISNDKKLNDYLLNPIYKHKRDYVVQVEGDIQDSDIEKLKTGININIKGKTHFAKCLNAQILLDFNLAERKPPIRFRANIPTSIIKLSLTEGKNRQVRRMTAAIGFPTLRLIRVNIENLSVDGIQSGEFIQLSKNEIYKLLKINF